MLEIGLIMLRTKQIEIDKLQQEIKKIKQEIHNLKEELEKCWTHCVDNLHRFDFWKRCIEAQKENKINQ